MVDNTVLKEKGTLHHSKITRAWNIEGKSQDKNSIKASNTYGTGRINAYKIIEETLNQRDVRIFDYIQDENGKKKPVLNKKETAIAQGKQELIKQAFQDWIWKDPQRREQLTQLYNTGHYHNHFVINSVSWADGYKFYNSPADYARMREVSDRLCREYAISVIENPGGRAKHYWSWYGFNSRVEWCACFV
ncbi:MAG: relaxase/mobilization nuclease domain-containing protein, partial [Dysosmobacter sp.]|nr:relaxase/mobilization nuclease domain-containing protein [Dysosmobacter sp.]